MKALRAIEEVYSMALNPDIDYLAQLQTLAPSGELANKLSSNQILFKICMIVDAQEKEIASLKEDRVAIAAKMVELEAHAKTTPNAGLDPTAPIQS